MQNKPATIKIVAKKVGIGLETIRYYQRIGLIEKPQKPPSGYRVYSEEAVTQLLFIQRAKELGFSLTEISHLLALNNGNNTSCSEVKALAASKLEIIKGKLLDLQIIAHTLERLIQSCEANSTSSTSPECPIISAILKK